MKNKSKKKPKESNKITLTPKMERFCLNFVKLNNATQAAVEAGYSPKTAYAIAAENLKKPVIIDRITQLRQKTEDATVMGVLERKQRLSEIGRAKLTDFMEMGQDGTWCNIGPESKSAGAVQEITSRTEYDDDSAKSTIHTKVKLHDPVKAIDLLNKMDKIYADNTGTQVNIDNRKVEILVISENAKQLTAQILDGVRTDKT